jgi:hypothetical protein
MEANTMTRPDLDHHDLGDPVVEPDQSAIVDALPISDESLATRLVRELVRDFGVRPRGL